MADFKATETVLTGIGSYMYIFEPKAYGNNEPKYSVAVLISKKDKKQLARIHKAIQAAKEEAQTKVWKGKMYPDEKLDLPLRDGDIERPDDPVYKGKYYINCKNKTKPGVVDQNVQPILDPERIYSGCVINASVNFFGYLNTGKAGISCGLNHVQLVADGEHLSGRKPASATFTAISEEDLAEIDEYLDGEELPDFFK